MRHCRRAIAVASLCVFSFLFSLVQCGTSRADECAPYARSQTGIALYGAAFTWWEQASGVYARGNQPTVGAALIFKPKAGMPAGHVAVVTAVEGPREIRVAHANWGKRELRGKVQRNIRVIDVSRENDWSEVRVWFPPVGDFGSAYQVYGFIYGAGLPQIYRASAPRQERSVSLLHSAGWLELPERHYTR